MTPVEMFHHHVPEQYLRNLLLYLGDAYVTARSNVYGEFPASEARNVLPIYRRGLIEWHMREIAHPFPQITASVESDPNSGFWNHTVVTCDGRVTLTQNSAPDPDHVVRPCQFREQYAENNQLFLPFATDAAAAAAAAEHAKLFGILLHGKDRITGRLAFAVVRFPLPDQTGYSAQRVSLFQLFPDIAASISSMPVDHLPPEEESGDEPDIELNDEDNLG